LGESGAVDFRELYFQENFLSTDGAEGEDVDDVLGIGGSQLSGAFSNIFGGDVAGEDDGGAGWRDGNLFLGEDAMLLFGAGADVDIDAEIEAARTFKFVPDEQGNLAGARPWTRICVGVMTVA